MELVVDLGRVIVTLADPDDDGRLGLRVGAPATASARSEDDVHRLHDVLVAANVGRLVDPGRALVRPDAVRFHAAGQVGGTWPARFASLCRRQVAEPEPEPAAAESWVVVAVAWPPGDEADPRQVSEVVVDRRGMMGDA